MSRIAQLGFFQFVVSCLFIMICLPTHAAYNGPGYYQIKSVQTGNCAGRDTTYPDNRGHLQSMNICDDANATNYHGGQFFYVKPISITNGTTINANLILRASGRCADTELDPVFFTPLPRDSRVIQYQCEVGRTSQIWALIPNGNGAYTIKNTSTTDQCLVTSAPYQDMTLAACTGGPDQLFSVNDARLLSTFETIGIPSNAVNTNSPAGIETATLSNKTFRLISGKNNKCLDEGSTDVVNDAIFEATCNNGIAQEWKLTPRPADKGAENYGYWIKSAYYEPFCLDALATGNGSRVSAIECLANTFNNSTQEFNQIWYLQPVGIEYYNQPYKNDGTRNNGLHFNLFERTGEKYLIVNKLSQFCLQTDTNGKAIQAICDGSDGQFWHLREVKNSGEASRIGQWSGKIAFPSIPVAAAVLPDGKVLTWSSWDRLAWTQDGCTGCKPAATYTAVYDPIANTIVDWNETVSQHDMFCPGTAYLPDGRLHVTGGGYNVKTTSIFDFSKPLGTAWKKDDDMFQGRWYNTAVTLPNGNVFTLGGSHYRRATGLPGGNGHGEVWQANKSDGQRWTDLPTMKMDELLKGTTAEKYITDPNNTDNPQTDSNRAEEHPKLVVAPNGKLFVAGPTPNMQWFDTDWKNNYAAPTVTTAGKRGGDEVSQNGVVVNYGNGKILKAGGNIWYDSPGTCIEIVPGCTQQTLADAIKSISNANAYLIDINNGTKVTPIPKMRFNRAFANGVVLPDGTVLIIGGSGNGKPYDDTEPRRTPELFNPATKSWKNMAPMATTRGYHSVAMLLPDGRVFAGGGGLCGTCNTNHPDAEIFSPPYLFKGTRPVITSAPATIAYASKFNVTTSGFGIAKFTLIRLSSVTHSVNTDQRLVELTAGLNGNNYVVSSPLNGNIAPPGYYMLFALDVNNIPSVAKIIKLN
ncbi:galactose oxidase-like domain-containing protein [Ampullimonas aquatilis]|uniref:galactose oxidase-like domain-containing protein n=1 Tax=Ampullimonas aquatilis TaxID=1341549 RepID=UPI003C77FD99